MLVGKYCWPHVFALPTAPDPRRPFACVGGVEPLVRLPPRVVAALVVGRADARVRDHGVLGVAEAGADVEGETREALVRLVHAGREAVADELDGPVVIRDLDDAFALLHVHLIDLHPAVPVRHAELECLGLAGRYLGLVDDGAEKLVVDK